MKQLKLTIIGLLSLFVPLTGFAQGGNLTISGFVTDQSGQPVVGAFVTVVGTRTGASTSVDGNYSVDAQSNATLQFSCVGFKTVEIQVNGRAKIDVTLEEDAEMLEEVVMIGFGSMKKSDLTGAVSAVKMDEVLGDRPVASVGTALKGAVPGLSITSTNGRPGGTLSYNIRGVNNLDGNSSPLVLVDNVEMDINMIDPNDIETVTVLKDAASSAIYGARAAFGVILITTKKGDDKSRMTVSYSNNFSFSKAYNIPQKASPLETVQLYKDTGQTSYRTGQNVDTWLELLNEYNANPSKYPDGYTMVDGVRYGLAENDLYADMLETGFQQTHNVSVSGGTRDLNYRMAFGMVSEDGILVYKKDTYDRYNVSSYVSSNAIKWLKPELDIKYSRSTDVLPVSSAAYDIWGSAAAYPSYSPTGYTVIDGEELPFGTPRNHIALSSTNTNLKNNFRVLGKVTVTPIEGLDIIGEYTYDYKSTEQTNINKKYDYADLSTYSKESSTSNSSYQYSSAYTDYNALNVYATYHHTWNRHDFTAMAGYNQEKSSYRYAMMNRTDMINEELPSISQSTGEYYATDAFSEYATRSLFYRLNYSFGDKYLIATTGRYDGSSKFPKNSRFGFFPSVSGAWRISQESFMEKTHPVLSDLKIRASWGQIGNQSIDAYAYVPGMSAGRAYWVIDGVRVTTLSPADLVSDSFTWEVVSTLDIGADLGLFKNRLTGTFDWYMRDTKGMLAEGMELPSVLGTSAPLQNTANLRSKGWELEVNWKDQVGDWFYQIGFNLSDARTRITKYNNESGLISSYRVGQELGEIWGYVTDRFYTADDFNADGSLKAGIPYVEGYNPNPGDILYVDQNGDGVINSGTNTVDDPGDRVIIGNNTARYNYGITGGVSWKGISFSFILQGVGKRDRWIMNDLYYPHYTQYSTLYKSQLDYWTESNTDTFFPRIYANAAGNTGANTMQQTKFLSNGAYLSIRNITLSYTFPTDLIGKARISQLSVFFSGENLYTFHHLRDGLDPERTTDELGTRGWTYPYMRQYSFGINISF